jgi:hypothetical protein
MDLQMKRMNLLVGVFLVSLCGTVGTTIAATINVSSFGDGTPSQANAQSAYNAAAPGDTIVFPGGNATWSTRLTIGKPLTIVGNGTTLTAGVPLNTGFFCMTAVTSTNLMRITGFTFNLVDFKPSGDAIHIENATLDKIRIDHNTFRFGYTQIACYGAKGVIDHNYFYNPLKAIDFGAGTLAQANASWDSMAAGTADAIFIEDNQFVYDETFPGTSTQESIGTENGGKLVIRYNTWVSTNIAGGIVMLPVMTHGSAGGGVPNGYWQQGTGARRGQSVVEINNNAITGARVDFLCILRGSANLVYDNTLDCTVNAPRVMLREEEGDVYPQWDPSRTAWPAEDQVHNSFFWNNTLRKNGIQNVNYVEVFPDRSTTFIQEGRDYFLHAPQASGGRETFTRANGASSSYPTDGVKYATLGTMVFTPDGPNAYYPYTPYTYPHPLTAGPAPKPAPPTNLRIQQ